MTTIEKLKQGCGNKVGYFDICGDKRTGKNSKNDVILCSVCKAKLSQHTEDVEEFKKKINDFKGIIKNCGNLKVIEYFDKIENEYKTFWVGDEPYINVILHLIEEDLLSSLEKDDEKEIGGMK